MKHITAALLFSMVVATGCTVTTGDMDIAPTGLAGTVGGQTWSFKAGHTDEFLSRNDPNFFATLHATAFTPCGFSEPSGPHLIVAIPKLPGDYDMDLSRNMTFVQNDNRNLVSFDGRIIVDEVTPTRVVGGLHGIYDGANEVNGRFEITVCAD